LLGISVVIAAGVVVAAAAMPLADPPKPSSAASAAELAAAAEAIVESLEPTVANADSFKGGAEEVEHKGYVIALLANAVSEAEGDAKWKANALSVRDAAVALAKAKAQGAAQSKVKEIKGMFGGGSAGEAKSMKYLDITSLQHVMKEVNDRNRALTKNIKTATKFKSSQDTVTRDAQMLAFLGAIARADTKAAQQAKKPQADYEKFADALVTNSKTLTEASKKGDANAVGDAFKAVRKACADCHADFRPDVE
jgi:cytochrome c556